MRISVPLGTRRIRVLPLLSRSAISLALMLPPTASFEMSARSRTPDGVGREIRTC